jgi:hypothetical protein
MKKAITFGIAATLALLTTIGTASASHEHWLQTPGTCVEDIARGQTGKEAGAGGYHRFHENVHLGQPGAAAFDNGPVTVGKGATCS